MLLLQCKKWVLYKVNSMNKPYCNKYTHHCYPIVHPFELFSTADLGAGYRKVHFRESIKASSSQSTFIVIWPNSRSLSPRWKTSDRSLMVVGGCRWRGMEEPCLASLVAMTSDATAPHASYPPPQMPKEMKLKKGKSSGSFKGWSLNDPELQRKKRVAGYKVYAMEGKMKGSMRKSFRWIKDRYTQVVYGWW